MKLTLICFLFLCLASSCSRKTAEDSAYTPKPKGYPRIDLPKAEYTQLGNEHPYWFEYSKYAVVKPDTFKNAEPHWIFVYYPDFKANIQLTYKPVNNDKIKLAKMIADAHKLVSKHNVKASRIEDFILKTPSGKTISLIELDGEVPSYLQFYTTDSTKHFLRGALYFNTATAKDSLAPIIEYVKKDLIQLVNTLKWRN
jgi:gliding motility-associated lipoprotein GldD